MIFIHGCLNEKVQAFKKAIDELAQNHKNLTVHYRYSEPVNGEDQKGAHCSGGFIDAALIESLTPSHHADYYFCGPKLFMVNIYQDLLAWGIPGSQVHFEFFGPKQELEKKAA